MKKILIAIIILVLAFLAYLLWGASSASAPSAPTDDAASEDAVSVSENGENAEIPAASDASDIELAAGEGKGEGALEEASSQKHIVLYTDAGYEPKKITVAAGDTVVFENRSGFQVWTASDSHPTHVLYPGSDIKKCGTGAIIFDSCGILSEGESFSFTFNEKGSWGYHNHRNPGHAGIVEVK
ncbi:plastocyanin/azurin family copper-binding protein [bacterium]|nr:plastocyanin/azurin family copper-binding protein [bacterium]MCI0680420.1 plastocyanin/azurin family copper-binding protein [bacterium]